MGKKDGKPRGKMSSYAFFVQTCREEHKKKHPGESVNFSEFSRKCADKWKSMGPKEKKRFEDMAAKDKERYQREMANYDGPTDGGKRKKKQKDPNAPKRALSAFFFFCNEHRAAVKAKNPSFGVGDIAKALGKQWEECKDRAKYDQLAAKDKKRYEAEMASYKAGGGGGAGAKRAKPAPKKKVVEEEDDDDDDEEEDDDDDDEEDEDDD